MAYADPQALRDYQRQWMAERRAAYFDGKVCCDCGGDQELEVHHRDPSHKIASNVWSWSAARREAELAKCIILCRDCHVERHYPAAGHAHGTLAGYLGSRTRPGCRCGPCRAAKAAYRADRVARLGRE